MHVGGTALAAAAAGSGSCTWPRSWPPPRSPRRGTRPRPRPRRPRRSSCERHVRRDAGVPRGGPGRAGRHPAAPQPGARHAHDPRQAGPGGRRGRRTGRSCGSTGAAIKDDDAARPRAPPRRPRGVAAGARARSCTGPTTPPRPTRSSPGSRRTTASTRSSRSSRWRRRRSASTRRSAEHGIAAWETDLAELIVQLGEDLPSHILVPAIHRNRAEIREIFRTRDGGGRAARRRTGLTDDPAELAGAARLHLREKFLRAKVGGLGRELRGRRDRHARRGRVRGQRPDVPDPARGADLGRRHREGGADLGRPRRVPPAAAAVLDRGADEPVHLHLVRRHARRRPAGGARRTPRQRPHPRAGRRGGPPGAALHPLLGLPQRVPGLRAGGRARLRLGLPRPDRRDPQPAAEGDRRRRADRLAAVRLLAVRRLLRGLPGPHRHPRGAGRTCARRSSTRTAATPCRRPRRWR